jgi:Bacterial protein of unknown function (Gcw_chp)
MKALVNKLSAFTLAALMIATLAPKTTYAADVSIDIAIVSSYVWRGILVNEDPVLQPSLTVDLGSDLSFNLWGNMDLTGFGEEVGYGNRSGEFTELDLTGEYSKSFGPISAAIGIISYIFPGLGATTHELYGTISADVLSSPSLTIYSDVDEVKGSYFLLGIGHSFALAAGPLTGIDLGLSLGYGSGSYNRGYFGVDKAALVDLSASLGLPMTIANLSITPSVLYSSVLDSEIKEALDKSGYFLASLTLSLSL